MLKRSADFKRITDKRWYLPMLLLMPAVSFVVYGLMLGLDLPLPISPTPAKSTTQVLADLPIVSALLMFAAFFIGALGEELGWSGYVLDPLQERWSALGGSLIRCMKNSSGTRCQATPTAPRIKLPPSALHRSCSGSRT